MKAKEKLEMQQREHVLFMAKAVELLAQHKTKQGGSKGARNPKSC
ncbi:MULTISPECIES: hypothetical protein [unclassified Paenibacillus]|nr:MULTISPECIES: hypothetical protein [unclassified Paenibacillus]